MIQADGDGIISLANAGNLLYYGIWETDMARRIDLKTAGRRSRCPFSDGRQHAAFRYDQRSPTCWVPE
jgi:hypothetical protein